MTGAGWTIFGLVFSRILTLAVLLALGNILEKELFGRFCVIRSTLVMLASIASVGLGPATSKHLAQYRKTDPDRAGHILGLLRMACFSLGLLAGMTIFFLAPWLASDILGSPELTNALRLAAPLTVLYSLRGMQSNTFIGFEAFGDNALQEIMFGALLLPITVIGALLYRVEGVLVGMALTSGIICFFSEYRVRKHAKAMAITVSYRRFPDTAHVLSGFALPTTLCSFLFLPSYWAAEVMLVRFSSGFAESAIYAAANQWRQAVLCLPLALSAVVLPILSSVAALERSQRRQLLKLSFGVNVAIGLAVCASILLSSRLIMSLYGPGFMSGVATLELLAVSALFACAGYAGGTALLGAGYAWLRFWLHLSWAVTLVFVSFVLLRISPTSASLGWANVIAFAVHCIVQCGFAYFLVYRRGPANAN